METQLKRILSCCVLVLMLLEVHSMALPVNLCGNLTSLKDLANLLLDPKSKDLLKVYNDVFRTNFNDTTPDDLPDSNISGINFSEKFQDIYNKTKLFSLHISKVKEYQNELSALDQRLEQPLNDTVNRLEYLSASLKKIIKGLKPDFHAPTEPATLLLNHDVYNQKKYGWHVINRLRLWLSEVVKFLEEKELCNK